MSISPVNIVYVVVAVAFLAFHTFLFTNLNDQLERSLRRIDDLEEVLKNSSIKKSNEKTIHSNCLRELQMRLHSELTNADDNDKVLRALRRIHHLSKRVEKCISHSLIRKRYIVSGRPRRSFSKKNSCDEKKIALYTVWGQGTCPRESNILTTGQMVTTDGSDYICLTNEPDHVPLRPTKTKGRNLGSNVNLTAVTYNDIEDVFNFYTKNPPFGPTTRNNKTVPCAICARRGKSSSKTIVGISREMYDKKFPGAIQQEYFGVLMSAKESKKLICLTIDARGFNTTGIKPLTFSTANTVKIYPAELRCNSMYCDTSKHYQDEYRVRCMVVTF